MLRRGEHGTAVVFWKLRKVAATVETYPAEDEHDLPDRVTPLLRSFTVFNVAQIDGLPPELMTTPVVTWLGGWASAEMVRRYAHLAADHLAPDAERLCARPAGEDKNHGTFTAQT